MNSIEHSDESGTWVLAATGFTTPIEDAGPKVIKTCVCPELGYWCAEYITEEMKKNLSTPQGIKLKALVSEAFSPIAMAQSLSWWQKPLITMQPGLIPALMAKKQANAMLYWKSLVGYRCIWDHKPYLEKKLKEKLASSGFEITSKQWRWSKLNNFDYFYDIWSNIHYGYIGYHAGFFAEILKGGASVAQLLQDLKKGHMQFHFSNGWPINDFDDITDQISICIGIELAKRKNPEDLSISDLLLLIEEVPVPWGDNASQAKREHECLSR